MNSWRGRQRGDLLRPSGKSSSGRQGKPQKTDCKKRTTKSTLQKAVYKKQSVFYDQQEADCKRQFANFPAIKKDARPVANRACASFLFCDGFFFAGDDPPKRGRSAATIRTTALFLYRYHAANAILPGEGLPASGRVYPGPKTKSPATL